MARSKLRREIGYELNLVANSGRRISKWKFENRLHPCKIAPMDQVTESLFERLKNQLAFKPPKDDFNSQTLEEKLVLMQSQDPPKISRQNRQLLIVELLEKERLFPRFVRKVLSALTVFYLNIFFFL